MLKTICVTGTFLCIGDGGQIVRHTVNSIQVATPLFVVNADVDIPALLQWDIMLGEAHIVEGLNTKTDPIHHYRIGQVSECDKLHKGCGEMRPPEQSLIPQGFLFIEGTVWADCLRYEMMILIAVSGSIIHIITPHLSYAITCEPSELAKVLAVATGDTMPTHFTTLPEEEYWRTDIPRVYAKEIEVSKTNPKSPFSGMTILRDHRNDLAHRKVKAAWEAGEAMKPRARPQVNDYFR